ncbi:unnamed protein product [Phytophthora fragariaefolia]|uniref:Unnamed protein product n=1 Tax=Phytophthora fragariaefolia TaxID=1490495 RepID=A0A9W6YJ32_9STRA|nr:unnamed protein product [Phytophthora fragariaefolia]
MPIGEDWNEAQDASTALLPVGGTAGAAIVTTFQSLVGSLLWIARCTRPDIAFAVHKATRRTHAPTVADWKLAKRVLRYLAGTRSLKLRIKGYGGVDLPLDVVGYSDADYAGDKVGRKSTTEGLITVDGMVVSWICRKQGGVSLSTMEAEYIAASVVAQELLRVRELLGEMKVPQKVPMKLCVDNQAALKQLEGEQSSGKAKHIDVRIKFVVDYVRRGVLRAEYLETKEMPADVLTKAVNAPRMQVWDPVVLVRTTRTLRARSVRAAAAIDRSLMLDRCPAREVEATPLCLICCVAHWSSARPMDADSKRDPISLRQYRSAESICIVLVQWH